MSGENYNVSGRNAPRGAEKAVVDHQVRTADGHAYVKVFKDGKHYRLSAEGLFGDRLRTFAEGNRSLNPQQMDKIATMVDNVFFASGQVKTAKTLDIKFADDITSYIDKLCAQREELIEGATVQDTFITHTAFEGTHVAHYTQYVAETYIELCRDWKDLDFQSLATEKRLGQAKDQRDENLEIGLSDTGERLIEKEGQIDKLSTKEDVLQISLQASSDRLTFEPDNQALQEEFDKLSKELAALKKELSQVRRDRDAIAEERDALKAALNEKNASDKTPELSQMVEQLKKGMDDLRADGAILAQKNRELHEDHTLKISAKDDQIQTLQEKLSGLQERDSEHASALLAAQTGLKSKESAYLAKEEVYKEIIADLQNRLTDQSEKKGVVEEKLAQAYAQMAELQERSDQMVLGLQAKATGLEKTVQQLTEQRDVASAEANHANSSLNGLRAELQHSEERLASLEGERNELAKKRETLSDALDQTKARNEELLQQLQGLGGTAQQLSTRVGELEGLQGELELKNEQCKTAIGERNDLRAELHARKAELEELRSQNHALSGKADKLEGLQEKLHVAEEQLQSLAGEKQNLQTQVAQGQAHAEHLIGQLSKVGGEKGQLADQLADALLQKNALNEKLATAASAQGEMGQTLAAREVELDKLRGELDQARGQARAMEGDHATALAQKNEELSQLRGDLLTSTTQLTQIQSEQDALTAEHKTLQGALSQMHTQTQSLLGELENAGGERGELAAKLAAANAEKTTLFEQLGDLQKDRGELGAQLQASQDRVNSLQGQIEAAAAERGTSEKGQAVALLQKDQQLRAAQAQLQGSEGRLEALAKNYATLNSEGDALRADLQGTRNLARELTERVTHLEGENSQFSERLTQLSDQNDALSETLLTLQSERGNLQAALHTTQDQCDQLQAELKTSGEDRKAMALDHASAMNQKVAEANDLKGQLLRLDAAMGQLERQRESLLQEQASLKGDVAEMRGQIDEQLTQLTGANKNQGQTAEQLANTVRENAALTAKLTHLEKSQEALIAQATRDRATIETLQSAQLSQTATLEKMTTDLSGVRSDLQRSTAELASLNGQREDLKLQLAGGEAKIQQLLSQMQSLGQNRGQLAEELAHAISDKEKLASALTALETIQVGAASKSQEDQAQITRLQVELERAHAASSASDASHLTAMTQKTVDFDALRTDLQGQVAQGEAQIQQLLNDVKSLGGDKAQLADQLDKSVREKNALRSELSTVEGLRAGLAAQIFGDQAKISTLQTELDRERSASAAGDATHLETMQLREAELRDLQSKLQLSAGELATITGQRDALRGQVVRGDGEVERLTREVQKLGGKTEELAGSLHEARTREASLQKELDASNDKLGDVSNQLAAGGAKIAGLTADLETSSKEKQALESKIEPLNHTIEELQTTVKMTQLKLDAEIKEHSILKQFVESDPAAADMKPLLEKMQRDCEYYVNHLPTNAVLFHSQQIDFEKINSTIQEIGGRSENAPLSQQDINTFTTAAFCQIAKGGDGWKTALEQNKALADRVPPQLKAFAASTKGSVDLDVSKQRQLISDCKRVILAGEIEKEDCAKVVKQIEASSRDLIRTLIKNVGIDNPPINLQKAHEELLKPNSTFSKVLATFKPEVKEQLCILAYYQNAVANLGKKREGDTFSTHDQWDFLVHPTSENILFTPKPENLLHLVDALKGSRLQGATLSSSQMDQLADIFSMMNKGTQSANMFSAAGSGKTTIVELTMLLTNKLTDIPPEFHYISSIPSTVKDVKSHLFGDLVQKEVDGVNQILIDSALAKGSTRRQIVFIDEAHRISSTSEVYINGSPAQNVRITATPSMRTSLLAEHGESIAENVQQLGKGFSGELSRLSSDQVRKMQIEDVRGQVADLLKSLPRTNLEQLRQNVSALKEKFFKDNDLSKIPVQLRDFHASLIKALKTIPETSTVQEYIAQLTESSDASKFPGLTATNIEHLKLYKENPKFQEFVTAFKGTRHDPLVNMARKKDLINLQAELNDYSAGAESTKGAEQLLANALALGVKPGEMSGLTAAMRVDAVAQKAFSQRSADINASAAREAKQSEFLRQVEERRSFTNLSKQIGERYAQVDCKSINQLDPFVEQLKGKIGLKNQVILPNFVLDDHKVDGIVKLFRSKLELGNDTAFLYTNAKGEKKAIVGSKHLNLSQLKEQKGIERLVMLYDERTAAGGDFEQYSQNNAEDTSIRQFLLFNTQVSDSLNRKIKTDTLVQGLGRLRKGTRRGDSDNVETYLFGGQAQFGNETLEGSLFQQLHKTQEEGYRETEVHELASALTGFVTRAYSLATGGSPKAETLGVYAKVATGLQKATPQELKKLNFMSDQVDSKDQLNPIESIKSMVNILGHLGIDSSALERIRGGMEHILRGDLAADETLSDENLEKTTNLAGAMTGILQGAMQAHFAATRLARSGTFGRAAQAA